MFDALSRQPRYGPGARRVFSVAEHSLVMALFVLRDGRSTEFAREALIHDGSEALTQDLVPAVKEVVRSIYKPLEHRIAREIRVGLGLPEECSTRIAEVIDRADKRWLVAIESQRGVSPLGFRLASLLLPASLCAAWDEVAKIGAKEVAEYLQVHVDPRVLLVRGDGWGLDVLRGATELRRQAIVERCLELWRDVAPERR